MVNKLFLGLIVSYLIGCFNTGYYYIKFKFNKDIRSTGSYGTGATNVSRIDGKKGFIITFMGDSLKSIIAIIIARSLNLNYTEVELCLLVVIVGHIFPIQLDFKGGKGIASFLGGLLIFDYNLIILFLINFLILFVFIRNYKVNGLLSLLFLLSEYIINNKIVNSLIFSTITLVILFAHRENIKNKFLKVNN